MSEQNVMKRVMLALSRAGAVVFRQNVGQGVVGGVEWIRARKTVVVNPGDAVVRGARVFHAGLCTGSSDLIGWNSLIVTPEMVGRRVAVFTAIETKAEKGGHKREEQVKFVEAVRSAGGIAGFANSPEVTVDLLREYRA